MPFLPEDYSEPTTSQYMDFAPGENVFRVLGDATLGWEYWREEVIDGVNKARPRRVKEYDSIPLGEVVVNKFGNLNLSFFWAMPVYNFGAKRIQWLNIKQKTVRDGISGYVRNKKWGDPKQYNLVVTRSEDNTGRTEYTVIAEPKDELDPAILKKFKSMEIHPEAWMQGGNPFDSVTDQTASSLAEKPEVSDFEKSLT